MENQKEFENLPAVIKDNSMSLFFNADRFELAQRVAKVFASSDMVPAQFQGNVGNCVIALNLADRMGTDPFMLMQNMYIVHGKPGIEAKLAIALVNASGKFSPLQYQYDDKKTACYAHARRTGSNEECKGVTVSLAMAQAEGWMSKQGSKWKTMPELMLQYRAAMFFTRAYCPEALLGMRTREELYDVGAVDMEMESDGSFVAPETTEDLQSRILNGGKDADLMSEADVDMGKAQDGEPYSGKNQTHKAWQGPSSDMGKAHEKVLESYDTDWNPLTAPLQKQYRQVKQDIIMRHLEDRGVTFSPKWTGTQLHQALLADVPEGVDEDVLDNVDEAIKKLDDANVIYFKRRATSPDIWDAAVKNAKIGSPDIGLADLDEADRFDACFLEVIEGGGK